VRDGVTPILVAIFAVINEQHVAFYKNGSFLREMAGLNVMHMVKAPDVFEIQYCRVVGVRANVYERLLKVLEIKPLKRKIEILDVVRPLIQFAAQLPDYSHKTNRLSAEGKAVRFALENAKEPATLLFDQLPAACGFRPFRARGRNRGDDITSFIEKLKETMAELRTAYSRLQERAGSLLIDALDLPSDLSKARATLGERVNNLLMAVNEPRLRGFCLRLADQGLADTPWLESVCSLVSSMPPSKWIDADEDRYAHELESLAMRFRRVESLSFQTRATPTGESAMRISITRADGSEVDNVIYLHREDEKRIAQVESEIVTILNRNQRIGLAATARAFWNASTLRDSGNVEELVDRDVIHQT
jgi:hypothetical protein